MAGVPDDLDDGERPRRGWDVVIAFLILNTAICAGGSTEHRPAVEGDPNTLRGGLAFLLWGTVCLSAGRFEHRSILFQIVNGKPGGRQVIGWVFTALAVFLLGRYAGIL